MKPRKKKQVPSAIYNTLVNQALKEKQKKKILYTFCAFKSSKDLGFLKGLGSYTLKSHIERSTRH